MRRRRAFASRDTGNDEPKESVVQYDNEAFTDDDQSEDRPAPSPSVSPSSARPSPRLLPPLRERVAETSEENLLTSDDYVPDEQLACKIVKAEYKPRVDTNLHFPSSSKVPLSKKLRDGAGKRG
ncbi:hypothetical protein MTO96_012228 [Rhipicephalus appendiculatus]